MSTENSNKVYEVLDQVFKGAITVPKGWEQLWGVIDAADARDRLAVDNENLRGINARLRGERDNLLSEYNAVRNAVDADAGEAPSNEVHSVVQRLEDERDRYAEALEQIATGWIKGLPMHCPETSYMRAEIASEAVGMDKPVPPDTEPPEGSGVSATEQVRREINAGERDYALDKHENKQAALAALRWVDEYSREPEGSSVSSGEDGDALEQLRWIEHIIETESGAEADHALNVARQALTVSGVTDEVRRLPDEWRNRYAPGRFRQLTMHEAAGVFALELERAIAASAPEAGQGESNVRRTLWNSDPSERTHLPTLDNDERQQFERDVANMEHDLQGEPSQDEALLEEIRVNGMNDESEDKLRRALRDRQRVPGQPDIDVIITMCTKYNEIYRKSKDAGRAMRAAIDAWKERAIARAEGSDE